MRVKTPLLLLFTFILLSSIALHDSQSIHTSGSKVMFDVQTADDFNPRMILPVYVRLQAAEKSNVTLWESVPQNFSDHVASIESRVLAMFISSNALGFNLSSDSIGNLWLVGNYSLNAGQYLSTLTWVSSKTISENLSSLGFASWPSSYPKSTEAYLQPGRKIEADNQTMQALATQYSQSNMTQTVKDVLDFVNTQGYDRPTTQLLMSGNLTTSDILDVFKNALQVYDSNSSICLERSWYAAAILRAAGVPTRTVTDLRLKTWVQVWLPDVGWVDGETLCQDVFPHRGMLPKPLSTSVPWVIQNSSDAIYPLNWTPRVPMKVANLTLTSFEAINTNDYGTVLAEPVDQAWFSADPTKFRFPIVFKSDSEIYAALTQNSGQLSFSLYEVIQEPNRNVEAANATKVVTLGKAFSITLGNMAVSFTASRQGRFIVLSGFSVQELWSFDYRLIIPIVGVPVVAIVVWLVMKRRKSDSAE